MADKLCLLANSVGNVTSLHSAKRTNHSIIHINVKKNTFVQLIYLVYIMYNDIINKEKIFLYITNFWCVHIQSKIKLRLQLFYQMAIADDTFSHLVAVRQSDVTVLASGVTIHVFENTTRK